MDSLVQNGFGMTRYFLTSIRLWVTALIVVVSILHTPVCAEKLEEAFQNESPTSLLTLQDVLDRLEKQHPLLKRSQANITVARGRLLKALGKFEPNLVNDWELERLVKNGETKSVGFNDTFVEMRHPWGFKGFAGFRAGIGDVEIADLGVNTSNQPLLGIVFPLLRGFITNPESGELKKSKLAGEQAKLEIQQVRQELYLGAATQYWNWVAASKIRDVHNRSVEVAELRFQQIKSQVDDGARAQFDAIDVSQEIQWRRDKLIKAERKVDKEQFKLALFLWEGDELMVPKERKVPAFPSERQDAWLHDLEKNKLRASQSRPEVKLINLEAQVNHVDMDVAENNLLPDLTLEAQPTRKPGEFVLGLGYRFGVQLSFPLLQREARGDLMKLKGNIERLKLLKRYRLQQVRMDVSNAHSSMIRAQQRIQVARKALELAKQLVEGERTRFKLGITTLIVVNQREHKVLEANESWVTAMTGYQKAVALYQWAIGKWAGGLHTKETGKKRTKADRK